MLALVHSAANEAVPTGIAIGLFIMISALVLMAVTLIGEMISGWYGYVIEWACPLILFVFFFGICFTVVAELAS